MPDQGPQQFAFIDRPGKWVYLVLSIFLVMTVKDLMPSRSQTSSWSSKDSSPLTADANIIAGDATFPTTKKISAMKFYYWYVDLQESDIELDGLMY